MVPWWLICFVHTALRIYTTKTLFANVYSTKNIIRLYFLGSMQSKLMHTQSAGVDWTSQFKTKITQTLLPLNCPLYTLELELMNSRGTKKYRKFKIHWKIQLKSKEMEKNRHYLSLYKFGGLSQPLTMTFPKVFVVKYKLKLAFTEHYMQTNTQICCPSYKLDIP